MKIFEIFILNHKLLILGSIFYTNFGSAIITFGAIGMKNKICITKTERKLRIPCPDQKK